MSGPTSGAASHGAGPRSVVSLPDPPGPGARFLPVRGFFEFRRDPLAALTRFRRAWGDVVHFRFAGRRFYLLSHPDLVQDVLVTRHRNFTKSIALQRARVLLGNGLLTSEGELHLRQRRLAQPAFHRDRVAAMAGTMAAYAERASDRWTAGREIDAGREMNRVTLAIAGKTLFDADVEAEADRIGGALTDALSLFGRLTNPIGPLLDRLPLPGTIRFRRARARLDETILRIVAARRAAGGEDRGDLLSMLLSARDEEGDGGGMDDAQLRDELLTLFLAGHETTANALAWTWHLLAQNSDVERKLHAEVDAVLAGRVPAADDFPRLEYTRRVLAESMRLYPPAWTLGREPKEDFEAGGFRVEGGHARVVLLSPWVIHRDERFYPDPERFDPERWTPQAEASRPRYAYFPFGGGPRKCIGEGFAWMEGVLVLAAIARRWRLRHAASATVGRQPLITLRPVGLRMVPERR